MNPADDTPIAEALCLLTAAINDADAQVGRLPDDLLPADVVAVLRTLRAERQRLAAVEAAVEARVTRGLGKGKHPEHGIEVRAGTKTTWLDPRTLAWRAVEPLVLDRTSGETWLDPQRVGDLIDRIFDVASVAYFRVGTLRDFGVDFDDLVKREPGRRTVQFVSPGGDG